MAESPPVLFRAVPDRDTMKNHLDGILWFRSPSYFRKSEDDIRADPLEGVGSYELTDGTHWRSINDEGRIQPTFILSFSEVPLPQYGEYVLKVQNPLELKRRIERKLPQDISRVEWGKVRYDKQMELEDHPTLGEDRIRQYYSKPQMLAGEREWRLVITFRHSFPILNQTLKLHFGRSSLVDIFELQPRNSERGRATCRA